MSKRHRNPTANRHPMQRNVTLNDELAHGMKTDRLTAAVHLNREERRRLKQRRAG